MTIRTTTTSILLAVALLGVAGCGSSGEDTAADAPAPPAASSPASEPEASGSESESPQQAEEVVITIKDFEFQGPESVAPGATVTVINEDSAPHDVTSDEEGLFAVDVAGSETVTFTAPDEPGEYPYICSIHPAMTGSLVVQ